MPKQHTFHESATVFVSNGAEQKKGTGDQRHISAKVSESKRRLRKRDRIEADFGYDVARIPRMEVCIGVSFSCYLAIGGMGKHTFSRLVPRGSLFLEIGL